MTSAGPAPSWTPGSPAAAVPMVEKMPAPIIAPMPRAMSWIGPSVRFIRCSGASASARIRSRDFVRKRRLLMRSWRGEYQTPAASARFSDSRGESPRGSGSGRSRRDRGPRGREAALPAPRRGRLRRPRAANPRRGPRRRRRSESLAQVRRKISGSGLPVASIAETDTVWKNPERPVFSSRRGRCESQLDTTARGKTARGQRFERRAGRRGRPSRTAGSRKCSARRPKASSESGPPSSRRRTRPRKSRQNAGSPRTPP